MKKYRVWIGLAVLCVIVGVPQLTWKPSRFGGIFLLALAVGCTGEWLMLRGREKYRACRVLSRAGQMLFGLFVLTFALVQVCIIGVSFEENDPSAAPKADYYLTLGALVNPDGQPSAALAARCDAAIGVLNANQDSRAMLCGGQGGDQGTRALVNNLYGSSIVGSDGKWNIDANGVKALALLKEMYDNKSIDAGFDMAAADELQKFQQETCAMTFCFGTSAEITYASEDYTQIAVPFPSEDGKPSLEYLVNGFCVFDNKSDARAAAAKEFIKFICDDPEWGPKSVVKTNAFPVRTSFGDLYPGDEHKAMLASWSQYYGPYYNTRAGFAAMRPLWFNMLQQVFNGTDPQAAADEFNASANSN